MHRPSIRIGIRGREHRKIINKIRNEEYYKTNDWPTEYYSRCKYCGKALFPLKKPEWGMFGYTCDECFEEKTGIKISEESWNIKQKTIRSR